MSTNPSFTIVTPVLNGAKFLQDMLNSLRFQTLGNWQHIIVDGGSTDGSLDILKSWCAGDSRAQLVQEEGLGLYASILRGLDMAEGQLLAWLNCDDLYAPWSLQAVWNHHNRTGADWITGYPGCWDDAGTLRYVRPYGWYPKGLIRKGWFHERLLGFLQQESIFFSRDLYSKLTPQEREQIASCRLAGDWLLWRCFAGHTSLNVLPSAISGFRVHGGNLSSNNLDAYLDEVRSHGGTFLPGPLARLAATSFRSLSAVRALGRVRAEDENVAASLPAAAAGEIAAKVEQT
ncbi:glycosyltransferase [Hyphomonas sp.]|uniref:glycosyltransferase n=1 Tax=Hyphomonas sp. TaxID=87 RepID=UPI003527E9EE